MVDDHIRSFDVTEAQKVSSSACVTPSFEVSFGHEHPFTGSIRSSQGTS